MGAGIEGRPYSLLFLFVGKLSSPGVFLPEESGPTESIVDARRFAPGNIFLAVFDLSRWGQMWKEILLKKSEKRRLTESAYNKMPMFLSLYCRPVLRTGGFFSGIERDVWLGLYKHDCRM
jgi:hypothetical protein